METAPPLYTKATTVKPPIFPPKSPFWALHPPKPPVFELQTSRTEDSLWQDFFPPSGQFSPTKTSRNGGKTSAMATLARTTQIQSEISRAALQHKFLDLVHSTAQIQHKLLNQVWEFVLLWVVLASRRYSALQIFSSCFLRSSCAWVHLETNRRFSSRIGRHYNG